MDDKLKKMVQEELPNIILNTAFNGIKDYVEDGDWFYAEDFMTGIQQEIESQLTKYTRELCELPEFKSKLLELAEKNLQDLITNRL